MLSLRFILAPLFAIAMTGVAQAQTVVGTASAVDGDTLEFIGQRVRLHGVDAPEMRQTCLRDGGTWPCGAAARDHLASLVSANDVSCVSELSDASTVIAARCEVGGIDLGEAMVAAGLATVMAGGEADYAELAARVEARKIGIWATTFDPPAIWRQAHPETVAKVAEAKRSAAPAPSHKVYRNALGCAIKGNVSRRLGEDVYYLPGMNYYGETRPERLFCTEAEAQAAGFRRSRGG